jgi:hypothetical protein
MLRALFVFSFLFLPLLFVGCGPSQVPVAGVVTVDGQPLTTGSVTFHSLDKKSETGPVIGHSPIDSAGKYNVVSDGGSGLQAGSYKVVVNAGKPSNPKDPYSLPVLLVNKKFTDLATTPLTVQVDSSASPDRFNLSLTK